MSEKKTTFAPNFVAMKRLLFILLFLTALAAENCVFAEIIRGENGSKVFWTYNTETQEFNLFGSGDKWTSDSTQALPWFDYLPMMRTINISSEVTYIGNWAFAGCKNVSEILLPHELAKIGIGAFWSCPRLSEPIYNDSVFAYLPPSFEGVYVLPEGPHIIADGAFYGCTALTSVKVPETYTVLGNYTFSHCTNLTAITFNKCTFEEVGNGCFEECQHLKSIKIPDGVKRIGDDAFSGCVELTSVAFSNCLSSIGKRAFCMCSSLSTVKLPDTISRIADRAFYYCDNIRSVNIPNSRCVLGHAAFPNQTTVQYK